MNNEEFKTYARIFILITLFVILCFLGGYFFVEQAHRHKIELIKLDNELKIERIIEKGN